MPVPAQTLEFVRKRHAEALERAGSERPLSEHGARLDDFDRLLEGGGTQTRHVTITAPDEALAGKFGRLVQEAVAKRVFHP